MIIISKRKVSLRMSRVKTTVVKIMNENEEPWQQLSQNNAQNNDFNSNSLRISTIGKLQFSFSKARKALFGKWQLTVNLFFHFENSNCSR